MPVRTVRLAVVHAIVAVARATAIVGICVPGAIFSVPTAPVSRAQWPFLSISQVSGGPAYVGLSCMLMSNRFKKLSDQNETEYCWLVHSKGGKRISFRTEHSDGAEAATAEKSRSYRYEQRSEPEK